MQIETANEGTGELNLKPSSSARRSVWPGVVHDGGMPTPPSTRSIKISNDERGGWSSDRPRRDGAPARPANISVRCRVLSPSDRTRYSPGSLVVIVSASAAERERFAQRVLEDRSPLLSLDKVRALLSGRVAEDELEGRAAELLDATVAKRLEANEAVVITADTSSAAERERHVRRAAALKRPRHIILLETPRDQVPEEQRRDLNELRRSLDAGELGAEGFQTAMRLGGGSIAELKRIVFRSAPAND
jgi:predicted kinase